MYSIFADNTAFEGGTKTCIYNDITPISTYKVINPKLVMEDSAAGSLEFTLPPGNAGYDLVNPMTTDLVVYCDDDEIWRGRALTIDIDFYKRKKIYCEGELAFLNDTIQPPKVYNASNNTSVESFVTSLIEIHNENTTDNRKFTVGNVSVSDGDTTNDDNQIYRYTNYESTLKCFNEKLVDRLGGHLCIRHEDGIRYIDYLKKDDSALNKAADQTIQFGKNLLDYTQNFTMDQLATVIVPRGARLEEQEIEGLEAYLTVENATVEGQPYGSIYVESEEAVNTYGRIITVVDWSDVTDANNLLSKAQKYLSEEQFDKMSLEIKMVDLHYLNPSIKYLSLLEKVRCVSLPHGMDNTFQVTKIEINLSEPDNSVYTLGTDVKTNLTSVTNKTNNELASSIDNLPSENEILNAAKRNVFGILQGGNGGYVTFEKNNDDQIIAIKITEKIKESESLNMWKWNDKGLVHYQRSTFQEEWSAGTINNAITYDGQIVADRITTGNLNCDRLHGGVINGQTIHGGYIGNGDNIDTTTIDIKANSGVKLTFGSNSTWTNGCYLVTSSTNNDCHDGFGTRRKGSDDGCFLHWKTVRKWESGSGIYGWEVTFTGASDRRLKDNILPMPIENVRNLFSKLNFVKFNYKEDVNKHVRFGLIAQEVEKILDDVGIDKLDIVRDRGDGYLRIEYEQLERLCIFAVKDIYEKLENQQKEINILQQQIDELKGVNNG